MWRRDGLVLLLRPRGACWPLGGVVEWAGGGAGGARGRVRRSDGRGVGRRRPEVVGVDGPPGAELVDQVGDGAALLLAREEGNQCKY